MHHRPSIPLVLVLVDCHADARGMSTEQANEAAWEVSQALRGRQNTARKRSDCAVPCDRCGRKFNPDRLEVHQRSCKEPTTTSTTTAPTAPAVRSTSATSRQGSIRSPPAAASTITVGIPNLSASRPVANPNPPSSSPHASPSSSGITWFFLCLIMKKEAHWLDLRSMPVVRSHHCLQSQMESHRNERALVGCCLNALLIVIRLRIY